MFNCEWKEDRWLDSSRRNCRGGNRKLLWQFTVAIKCDPVAPGLFISRWVLQALGKTDFGLYGVVGGMTSIVLFLDMCFAFVKERFYCGNQM